MEKIIKTLKKSCIKISQLIQNSNSTELGDLANEFNLSGDDVKKASNSGPSPKMRQGDNKAGDKKIINPAKEVKG